MANKEDENSLHLQLKVEAYFEDIHKVLIQEISQAKYSITAAVAWFTDREILDALCSRARHGVTVQVAITDDKINRPPMAPAYHRLTALGGIIHRIAPGSRNASLMHHKFCVIDESTVITGSYNWTRRARKNDENISVVQGHPTFAARFISTFDTLTCHLGADVPQIDSRQIRKRLELVRNLIQLGEVSDAEPHIHKLRPVTPNASLMLILKLLDEGSYVKALERIEEWLSQTSMLVTMEDIEVPHLQLQLQALELELIALSAELADIERRLVGFNGRHDEALGSLIKEVLAARAELARLQLEEARAHEEHFEEAARAAKSAENQYRDYTKEHERLQETPVPPMLDKESEAELKRLYRKCSQRCHPDKVSDSQKGEATKIFQALQDAYQAQDLDNIREIFQALKSGNLSMNIRSSILSKGEQLRAAITEMEQNVSTVVRDLQDHRKSAALLLMERVTVDGTVWQAYVNRRRRELTVELEDLTQATISLLGYDDKASMPL